MEKLESIPRFNLFGEHGHFPDVIHFEHIKDRASEYGWFISPHRHPQMVQLFYIKQGCADVKVDGKQFSMTHSTLIFVPVEAVHEFSFAPNTIGVVVSFPFFIVRELSQTDADVLTSLSSVISKPMTSGLAQLLNVLEMEYLETNTYRILVRLGLAYSILAKVAELGQQRDQHNAELPRSHLAKLDRLIIDNMGRGLSPSKYAHLLSITTGHLSRICREEKGSSVSVYIESAIMTEAARLLAFTQLSISEIAYQVGFNDPSYFSRRFKLTQGLTPSDYKKHFVNV